MRPWISDLANSPGAVAHPKSRGNLVRPGGVLYGLCDDVLPQTIPLPELKPVMSLYSAIALIKPVKKGSSLGYGRTFVTRRDSVIGTIPIGYQDGYMRGFSNKAEVIVNGCRAPVVGRVSMDWTIVDLTDVPDAKKGTPVTLMGSDGSEEVTASELGSLADTISYEITCGVSRRVRRVFVDSAE
ncbi:MAG: alanine racemase [Pyrinomonadaceae bacterium]|nr:alanine racemase [Pyrinomonadaceae bacterium]